uniref:Putative transposase n=1 Tax=viral metagenome TaxID=1070528 RepID=A0A6M3XK30_9ZZZZ
MQRVERHIIIKDKQIDNLCYLSKNLYNYCNYAIRQHFFETSELLSEYGLTGKLAKEKQIDYISLPAQSSQQIIKLLFRNWKSFFKANKNFKNQPEKYMGKPKMPHYKHKEKGRNIIIFTNQQIVLKDGYVQFPKRANLNSVKTMVDNICQVRIIPQYSCSIIEIVYNKEGDKHELNETLHLAIDPGVNNLATCINDAGLKPFIINGRPLKSMNQYFNKVRAELMSFIGNRGTSNRIKALTFKRTNKVTDYLHKASRIIVNYCIENKIGTIVFGHNKGWKQETNMSKVNNQNFVSIPIYKLLQMVAYKAEEVGIKFIDIEESYTSKVDHLALEPLKHQEKYFGKRVKRGLFKSSTGILFNADVNGGIGILRKVVGDGFLSILNRGDVSLPIKLDLI